MYLINRDGALHCNLNYDPLNIKIKISLHHLNSQFNILIKYSETSLNGHLKIADIFWGRFHYLSIEKPLNTVYFFGILILDFHHF